MSSGFLPGGTACIISWTTAISGRTGAKHIQLRSTSLFLNPTELKRAKIGSCRKGADLTISNLVLDLLRNPELAGRLDTLYCRVSGNWGTFASRNCSQSVRFWFTIFTLISCSQIDGSAENVNKEFHAFCALLVTVCLQAFYGSRTLQQPEP